MEIPSKELVLVVLLGIIGRGLSQSCFGCQHGCGAAPINCPYGVVRDICGCCDECGKGPLQKCRGLAGRCGDGLECSLPPPPLALQGLPGICVLRTSAPRPVLPTSLSSTTSAPVGTAWTPEVYACIKGKNNLVLDRISLDNCKANCETQTGFVCRSLEYHRSSRRCVLSEATSSSCDYRVPCHGNQDWLFTETIVGTAWTPKVNACIKGKNNLVLDRISLNNCKANCETQTGFVCRSLEYHCSSRRCVLSEATSSSSDYRVPCHGNQDWLFTETIGNSPPECEGVKCSWNLWTHYDAKGCTPEYTNGSCCPTHFTCPQQANLNPDKCYLFGKEYNIGDDVPINGEDDKCFSGCTCFGGPPGERSGINCAQDVGLCWNFQPPFPGCRHHRKPCGGCPDEVCDDSIPHKCSWNNKTYEEGQYMDFDEVEYACHTCTCQKNFTGPMGEGCKRIRCGHSGINARSDCAWLYHKSSCCPFGSICDSDPKILSIPNTSTDSSDLTCTLGKFTRSVGESLENEDCRINCTCLTPPEFTCVETRNCLPIVPEAEQCTYSRSCTNGECRQDCGDLVEVADQCSGNGCKCCRHERCSGGTGICRMRCLDNEYEDTWTGFGCAFANGFKEPKPKCCVKIAIGLRQVA